MEYVETKIEDAGSENVEGLVPATLSCAGATRVLHSTVERPSIILLQERRGQ